MNSGQDEEIKELELCTPATVPLIARVENRALYKPAEPLVKLLWASVRTALCIHKICRRLIPGARLFNKAVLELALPDGLTFPDTAVPEVSD